jgi:hypothetical protein
MISKEKDMNKEGDGKKVRDQRTGRMNGIEKCIGFENWDSRNWDSRNWDFDKTCDSTGLERFRIPLVNES